MAYRLLKHKDYDRSVQRLPQAVQNKAIWAQVLLGIRGRTPSVKGTVGLNARWRRTPVQGNHYYLWWIPRSESLIVEQSLDQSLETPATNTILIHSIRHHDETDDPVDSGSLTDYEEVAITTLDPRYEEQAALSHQVNDEHVALATIKGLPGSGKTVSLLYLVKDLAQRPDVHHVLYITYTGRLKRAARDFLLAQDEAISQAVTIRTLSEVEHELTNLPTPSEPFTELREFNKVVELQNAATLGAWRKYPQTLYTEIRAHLLGKTFPPGYTLPDDRLNDLLLRTGSADASAYAAARELEVPPATLAYNFADRMRTGRFFQDQRAARRGLELLQNGKSPGWLASVDALIVDEVQDLTLVQIAFLGELVRARQQHQSSTPFIFAVAGDESQIVQPSGFDWGITKDLLGAQLGLWPEEFEFHYQRRSPRNLARLIDNTWRFYGYLPRSHRPSARRQAFVYESEDTQPDEGNGRILICPPPQGKAENADWAILLAELTNKPGRVIIDLTEHLRTALVSVPNANSDEVIFLSREIKGLERATVLVHGLNAVYERALRLCETYEDGNIPRFEARRLFDEMRVALSRSTETIILLERADAPVLTELGVQQIPGVGVIGWDVLIEMLQTEEMSELEVVEGYLDEVEDFFERGLWLQGYRRNRRAYELAFQAGDLALQREAEEQYIRGYLREADSLLQQNEWVEAYTRNQQADELAQQFGDPLLRDDVDEQVERIQSIIGEQARQQLTQAQVQQQRQQYAVAYQMIQATRALANMLKDQTLIAQIDESFTLICWQWATQLVAGDYSQADASQAATLFTAAAQAMQHQADVTGAQATQLLAERYQQIPQWDHLDEAQVVTLLDYCERYLRLVQPLNRTQEAYLYLQHWLDEAFANLHSRTGLYARWASVAQAVAAVTAYADLDDHMWDLENRLKLLLEQGKRVADDPEIARFRALIAAYNGDAEAASLTWEQAGDPRLAAEFARQAGDLERAYRLLHQARLPVPEDLATTVKAIRLLQQLKSKHTGLHPAERRALLTELAELYTTMASVDLPDENET